MGGLLTLGGLTSLFLPETMKRSLPQSIADSELVPLTNPFKPSTYKSKMINDNALELNIKISKD